MVGLQETWFSNWIEIHATVLGVTLGVLVVILWRPHRKVALGVLLTSLAAVLLWPTEPMAEAAQKPWYFLVAITAMVVFGPLLERLDF